MEDVKMKHTVVPLTAGKRNTPKILLEKFLRALNAFYLKDAVLVEYRVAERALTHKLAEHLQKRFRDYDVDCEYNKVGEGDPKRVLALIEAMRRNKKCNGKCEDCRKSKCVIFPDIIVHHRGKDENLLAVEAKASWSRRAQTVDFRKLQALIESYDYRYHLGIAFRFQPSLEATLETIKIFCADESVKSALNEHLHKHTRQMIRDDARHEIRKKQMNSV